MTNLESLGRDAEAVLRANDRGGHTVPASRLYPHQWAWDSGFAAIGWAHLDPDRALREIETLLANQWGDGRVPHIIFDPGATDYFPGPAFWENDATSTITNPPNWAMALEVIAERGGDAARIANLLPKVEASHRFYAEARDPLGWGGVSVVHPWESGRDNCPAWDKPMSAIDPERAPDFRRVDREKVANPDQRPTDIEYKRYAALVKSIAADRFGPGEFAVYDPFMTCMLIRADLALVNLARKFGVTTSAEARIEGARACVRDRFWDRRLGRCRFHDVQAGQWYAPDVLAAYAPVISNEPGLADVCAQGLQERFVTPYRVPTATPASAEFDPHCYWRGPAWVSMNWLLATSGVRPMNAIGEQTIDLVARAGFWEYFDPTSGQGLGTDQFTWTAALLLDLLVRR